MCMVSCDEKQSRIHPIKAGIPHGSILTPTLYNIYTADISHTINICLATYADNTGVIFFNLDINIVTKNL